MNDGMRVSCVVENASNKIINTTSERSKQTQSLIKKKKILPQFILIIITVLMDTDICHKKSQKLFQ